MGNVTSGSSFDRAACERDWANSEARMKLSSEDRKLWDSHKYTFRPFVYYDKIFVVWTPRRDGHPLIKDVLTVTSFDGSFQGGIWVYVTVKSSGQEIVVTHTPSRVGDSEVFAWVPYFNEFRYISAEWDNPNASRNLRMSVCFKMRHKPDEILIEGEEYLSELHVFRKRWPEYADIRF